MLMMDDIIRDGHPTLRKVAIEVPMPPSEEDRKILDGTDVALLGLWR